MEDIADKRELSAILDDEPNTGCSTFPIDTVTQSNDLPNEIDKSAALIDFSMTETQGDIETPQIVDDTNEKPIECSSSAPDSNVKAQPSDCSVITLSSEEPEMVNVHDISNHKNDEFKEDERSISCPPSELPDELFENSSSNDETASQNKRKTSD